MEDKWVYSTDSSVPSRLTSLHLSLTPQIVRVVDWVVRPCGVILNILKKPHAQHIRPANTEKYKVKKMG